MNKKKSSKERSAGRSSSPSNREDYLNAGKDLLEMKKKRSKKVSDSEMDMDLLLGSPAKKSKKSNKNVKKDSANDKKNKKDKIKEKKKQKSSSDDDSDDVVSLSDEEVEDKEVYERVYQDQRRAQHNLNRLHRRKQYKELPDEGAMLLAYIEANKCKDVDLESSTCADTEEGDRECTIMVRWKLGEISRHKLKLFQPFESIFEIYAEKENVPLKCISFETMDGTQIYPSDTIDKLKITIADIVDGCVVQDTMDNTNEVDEDDGKIEIKVQRKGTKEVISVRIFSKELMKKALLLVSQKLDVTPESIRLRIDGEVVEDDQTPEDLDLDGGEMFDLEITD